MKLIHISDIHINPEPVCGLDPVENFRRCLAHVEVNHADADRVVITGDLTHHGREESYRLLAAMLEASSLKGDAAPRLLIGNHDNRKTYATVFPATPRDANGFIQWTEETPAGTFIYMDTNLPGTHAGHYCAARRAWLRASSPNGAAAAGAPGHGRRSICSRSRRNSILESRDSRLDRLPAPPA